MVLVLGEQPSALASLGPICFSWGAFATKVPMLEFFILRAFYRKLAELATSKNRTASWGWLGVILWISGEIAGFMVATESEGSGYLAALGFAVVGAGIAYVVVISLSTVPPVDFPTATIHREDKST